MLAPLAPPEIPARSSAGDLQIYSRRMGADLRRSTSRSSTQCWTTLAHSMKGVPTQSASANSSRGRSARLMTRSNLEAMGTVHLHGATTTTATTINVDEGTTIAVKQRITFKY
jgi:hypothetical protein